MNQKKQRGRIGLNPLFAMLCLSLAFDMRLYAGTPIAVSLEAATLDRIAIDVNSERVLVADGQTLDVVRGDLLTLIDAWAKGKTIKIDAVDFVGFAPLRAKNGRDDRGFIIDTSTDLKPNFAKDKDTEKSIFEIQARSADSVIGSIYLHFIAPRLEKVEISINGTVRQLHDGDTLQLKSSDKIAVRHVVTNIRGNENVHHELRSLSADKGKPNKELIFARGDQVFGRIPLQWQE